METQSTVTILLLAAILIAITALLLSISRLIKETRTEKENIKEDLPLPIVSINYNRKLYYRLRIQLLKKRRKKYVKIDKNAGLENKTAYKYEQLKREEGKESLPA